MQGDRGTEGVGAVVFVWSQLLAQIQRRIVAKESIAGSMYIFGNHSTPWCGCDSNSSRFPVILIMATCVSAANPPGFIPTKGQLAN